MLTEKGTSLKKSYREPNQKKIEAIFLNYLFYIVNHFTFYRIIPEYSSLFKKLTLLKISYFNWRNGSI